MVPSGLVAGSAPFHRLKLATERHRESSNASSFTLADSPVSVSTSSVISGQRSHPDNYSTTSVNTTIAPSSPVDICPPVLKRLSFGQTSLLAPPQLYKASPGTASSLGRDILAFPMPPPVQTAAKKHNLDAQQDAWNAGHLLHTMRSPKADRKQSDHRTPDGDSTLHDFQEKDLVFPHAEQNDCEPAWSDTQSNIDPTPFEIFGGKTAEYVKYSLKPSVREKGSSVNKSFDASPLPLDRGDDPPQPDGREFEMAALRRQVEQLQYLLMKRADESEASANTCVPVQAYYPNMASTKLPDHHLYTFKSPPVTESRSATDAARHQQESPDSQLAHLASKVAHLENMIHRAGLGHRSEPRLDQDSRRLRSNGRSKSLEQYYFDELEDPRSYLHAPYPLAYHSHQQSLTSQSSERTTPIPANIFTSPESEYEPRVSFQADAAPKRRDRALSRQASASTVSSRYGFSFNATPARVCGSEAVVGGGGQLEHVAGSLYRPVRQPSVSFSSPNNSMGRKVAFMPPAQIYLDGDNRPVIFRDGKYLPLSQAFPEAVYVKGQPSASSSRVPDTASETARPVPATGRAARVYPHSSMPVLSSSSPPPATHKSYGTVGGGLHSRSLTGLLGKHKIKKQQQQHNKEDILVEDAGAGLKMRTGPGRGRMLVKGQ